MKNLQNFTLCLQIFLSLHKASQLERLTADGAIIFWWTRTKWKTMRPITVCIHRCLKEMNGPRLSLVIQAQMGIVQTDASDWQRNARPSTGLGQRACHAWCLPTPRLQQQEGALLGVLMSFMPTARPLRSLNSNLTICLSPSWGLRVITAKVKR